MPEVSIEREPQPPRVVTIVLTEDEAQELYDIVNYSPRGVLYSLWSGLSYTKNKDGFRSRTNTREEAREVAGL